MKKLTSLLLALATLFCLTACGDKIPEGELRITVPEGFEQVEPGTGLTEQYNYNPVDVATINMVAGKPDESVKEVTEQAFAETMKNGLKNELQLDVDLEIVYFKGGEFLGCPGYSVCYKFTVMGIDFTQYQIAASTATGSYVWTMSDIGGIHIADYEAAVKSAVIK